METTITTTDNNTSEDELEEEWQVQLNQYKSSGDEAFQSGNYPQAIAEYTDALALDPDHFVIVSNRSAAYLKNGEKSKALHDAQKLVKVKGDWGKSFTRLGAALLSLRRVKEATSAYQDAIKAYQKEDDAKGIKVAEQGLEQCRALREQLVREEKAAVEQMMEKQKKKDEEEKQAKEEEADAVKGGGEDDLLAGFFDDVNEASNEVKLNKKNKPQSSDTTTKKKTADNNIQTQMSDLGTARDQIPRILASNYEWKNLNPFYVLSIPHTSSEEEIAKRYKALSLLLHPDKCKEDRARDAFEEIRKANTQLKDIDKRKHISDLVETGLRQGKKEWESDNRKNIAATTATLEQVQSKAVMKLFADIEANRRDIERRKRKQEQREREQEDEENEKIKRERDFEKSWKDNNRVDRRVGNWRDFQGVDNKKKKV